ncbi:thioredoxin domain-containing protein [Candidatus Kaiserbacteria bacterium]|nr:thioredoxin domain-containing protein [Candidatus Kaiserbacteria bacterium]
MQEDTNAHSTPTVVAAKQSVMKDLMIPLSIVVAGLFIGAGLYFGGGSTPIQVAGVGTNPTPTAQPTNTTDAVDPVTDADHVRGSLDAAVKIVEFSDADCPYCSRFHATMQQIVAEQDDVAWVYRHFPLEQLHPQADSVALASECAAEIGGEEAFWTFIDGYIMTRGSGDRTAHETLIPQMITAAGVDQARFTECFENGSTQADVQADLNDAIETGGRGTPWSVVIGPSGKTYPLSGALPKAAVEQIINTARAEG